MRLAFIPHRLQPAWIEDPIVADSVVTSPLCNMWGSVPTLTARGPRQCGHSCSGDETYDVRLWHMGSICQVRRAANGGPVKPCLLQKVDKLNLLVGQTKRYTFACFPMVLESWQVKIHYLSALRSTMALSPELLCQSLVSNVLPKLSVASSMEVQLLVSGLSLKVIGSNLWHMWGFRYSLDSWSICGIV